MEQRKPRWDDLAVVIGQETATWVLSSWVTAWAVRRTLRRLGVRATVKQVRAVMMVISSAAWIAGRSWEQGRYQHETTRRRTESVVGGLDERTGGIGSAAAFGSRGARPGRAEARARPATRHPRFGPNR